MNHDGILDWSERLFLIVFFFLYFGVPALAVWASYCEKCAVDLRDLWTHHGKPDKLAVIILGTWWVHTCSMILWTLLKTINTTDYLTYMGWAVPIIAKMFAPVSAVPPPQEEKK